MTEREGDLDDCIKLVEPGVEWEIILHELQNQMNLQEQSVWITWVGERLDILEDRGLIIPIMKKVNKLRDEFFDALEKKQVPIKTK